jgi:peptidoglycan/xylan/chitin deacetylase (PgdA/CDA1 family)
MIYLFKGFKEAQWHSLKFKSFYKLIFELVYATIRFSGIGYLIRKTLAKNKLTIVVYHKPEVNCFEKHMNYLSKRYNFISMSELSDSIYNKEWGSFPKYPLLITIDDGWKENIGLLGIINKYKIRPTIFLTSHLINTDRNFWWTTVNKPKEINLLKRFPNNQRIKYLFDKFNYSQEKEYPENRQALNLYEIGKMKESVDFSFHTCFHPILTKCNDDEKEAEIIESKIMLEKLLGSNLYSFAYPNGNYDLKCVDILKENGIRIARTLEVGRNGKKTDPLRLKVTGVSDDGTINKLASELTGIPLFAQYLLNGYYFRMNWHSNSNTNTDLISLLHN